MLGPHAANKTSVDGDGTYLDCETVCQGIPSPIRLERLEELDQILDLWIGQVELEGRIVVVDHVL